jgi:ribonuclease T2
MKKRLPPLAALAAILFAAAFAAWERGADTSPERTAQTRSSGTGDGADMPGDFDFYVLALSWSPSWCASQPDGGAGEDQCDSSRDFGFVVHGLWPQREQGWPEFCDSPHGTRIDRRIADRMADMMPSRDLVFHQWRKHGSCSDLPPDAFFDLTRKARQSIAIPGGFLTGGGENASPREIEQAFMESNPSLGAKGIAVTCADGALAEVRICMNRDLSPRPCAEVDGKACRAGRITIPPAGG